MLKIGENIVSNLIIYAQFKGRAGEGRKGRWPNSQCIGH